MGQFCILAENLLPSWVSTFMKIEIESVVEVNLHELRPGKGEKDENEWMGEFAEQIKKNLLERFKKSPRKPLYQD